MDALLHQSRPLPLALCAAGIAVLGLILYQIFVGATNKLNHVPGPWYSSFTQLVFKYHAVRGRKWFYVHRLHEKYGPVVRVSPGEVSIVTLPAVKELYKMGTRFYKAPFYTKLIGKNGLPTSVFSTLDPKEHGHLRRNLANGFADANINKMEPYIARNADLTVQRMSEELAHKGYFDAFKYYTYMATDIIGEASFGESFKALENNAPGQYVEDLQSVASAQIFRTELDFLLPAMAFFGLNKSFVELNNRLTVYAKDSLARYYKNLKEDPDNVKPTLLTKAFDLEEKGVLRENQLLVDARGNIVAGTDTTANAATSTVWLLSQNPEAEQALIDEVSKLPEGFADEELRTLPVLENTLNEVLRVRPPVGSSLPRTVPSDGITFEGHFVPGGTTIGIPTYTLHRDPSIFEDPEKFDPTRWQNPTKEMKDALVPFGRGSRNCIGMHLAQLELRLVLARFYRRFNKGVAMASEAGMTEEDMIPLQAFLSFPSGHKCLLKEKTAA